MRPTTPRRPGEAAFSLILVAASAVLLWQAYGISGFRGLAEPGAVPMGTTAVMLVAALVIAAQTLRRPAAAGESFLRTVLPPRILFFMGLMAGYALLLRPLGFLPTSFLFLAVAIRVLGRRSLAFTLGVSALALVLVWIVFRLVFSVLMPEGIVPERELVSALRGLLAGR